MTITQKLRTLGTALGIGAAALLGSGCGQDKAFEEEKARLADMHFRQTCRDNLQRDINRIAVHQLFNGRRMHYDEFIEATGIKRTLGKEYDDFVVWVDVVGRDKLLDDNMKYWPIIQDPHTNEERYVQVKMDSDTGSSALGRLQRKGNEYLGIKPLPLGTVDGFP